MTDLFCSKCGKSLMPQAVYCINCGAQSGMSHQAGDVTAKKRNFGCIGCLTVIAAILVSLAVFSSLDFEGKKNKDKAPEPKFVAAPPGRTVSPPLYDSNPHDVAMQNAKILKMSWYKDAFDTIMKANFTIRNDGDLPVKDLQVKCVHSAPSGTIIDSNTRTIFEIIPAHHTKSFRNFDMGFIHSQAISTACKIEDLTVIEVN